MFLFAEFSPRSKRACQKKALDVDFGDLGWQV